MNVFVLDIGGTSIKHGLCTGHKLGAVSEMPTEAARGGRHVMDTVISILRKAASSLASDQAAHTLPFDAVGVSTAGQVNAAEGSVIYANQNIPGYTGMGIRRELEALFPVPVMVENDVNAAAIGEAVYGAGRDYGSFLMLTYGTGVGGAVVTDRKVFHGSSYSASEFGAIITHSDARLAGDDYFDGCYEKYASATGLVKLAQAYRPELDDGRKIFSALEDAKVMEIIDRWTDEIMLGLATLTHIYNPACILLGGGVMEQPLIQEKLAAKKGRFIMPSFSHVDFLPAALGNSAGLMGANYLAAEYAAERARLR